MERDAGSGCMMHPWVRDDSRHELYSPLLLQYIPNPRAGWLDSCTETCPCGISWRQRVVVGLRVPPAWHEGCREGGAAERAGKACLLLQYCFGVPSPQQRGLWSCSSLVVIQ